MRFGCGGRHRIGRRRESRLPVILRVREMKIQYLPFQPIDLIVGEYGIIARSGQVDRIRTDESRGASVDALHIERHLNGPRSKDPDLVGILPGDLTSVGQRDPCIRRGDDRCRDAALVFRRRALRLFEFGASANGRGDLQGNHSR